jgi:hypothetical protein
MATKKSVPAAAPAKPAAKPKATGTAVAVKKTTGGALVDIKAMMAAELAGLANRTAPAGGDKIQLKDKKFHLPDGTQTDTLNVVIVDFMAVNNFYEGAYDAKNIVPPTCFAIGQIPTQMVPSDNAPVKQSDACASCPMNQFGSAGDGKACKNMRRLAVLPPDADTDTPLWILDVSPTGLKSFDGYVRSAASKFGVTPIGLITEITFAADVSYASLRFGNPEPNEQMAVHWQRRQEATDRLTQEPDVSGYEDAPPARGRGAAKKVAGARR